MYTIEVASMPFNGLDYALNNANGRLSKDGSVLHFSNERDLELYNKFLRGPSWGRFRLDNFVFQLLKFLDLDKAWHYYSIFNVNSKSPSDPYHGTDLTKILLSGVHEYASSGNHADLRVVIMTILFQSFNHSLGKLTPAQDAVRAQQAFKMYAHYRYVDPVIADHVSKLLHLQSAETIMSREARLVRDLNRAVVALKPPHGVPTNVYDRLFLEQRNERPRLDRKTFLTQELKALAMTQFETSWARAVIVPVWMNSVVGWAANFSLSAELRFSHDDLQAWFLANQPAQQQHSLTRPGSLSMLSSLAAPV